MPTQLSNFWLFLEPNINLVGQVGVGVVEGSVFVCVVQIHYVYSLLHYICSCLCLLPLSMWLTLHKQMAVLSQLLSRCPNCPEHNSVGTV